MTTEITGRRSILVPIDLHGITRDNLESLVRIARLLHRGVLGLLLEDIRLQQVAALPFTTEISLGSGQERSLLRDHLSQRHSLVTTDTRRLLNELANRNRVELAFENASGTRLHTALERDGKLDIFFPARQRWQLVAAQRSDQGKSIRRLGLVLTNTEQGLRVLEAAHHLLEAGLVGQVYVLSEGAPASVLLEPLYRPDSRICVQSNLSNEPATIVRLIRQSAYDLLLLPRHCLLGVASETLDTALDKSAAQVLIVN